MSIQIKYPKKIIINYIFFIKLEDCSRAYELLTPHCESNLEARKNCLARRGAALVKVGLIRQGYEEIVTALKLKHDDVLERDAEMLRCMLENSN